VFSTHRAQLITDCKRLFLQPRPIPITAIRPTTFIQAWPTLRFSQGASFTDPNAEVFHPRAELGTNSRPFVTTGPLTMPPSTIPFRHGHTLHRQSEHTTRESESGGGKCYRQLCKRSGFPWRQRAERLASSCSNPFVLTLPDYVSVVSAPFEAYRSFPGWGPRANRRFMYDSIRFHADVTVTNASSGNCRHSRPSGSPP